MPSEIKVWPHEGGEHVEIEGPCSRQLLTAQEAYDLHQAIGAVLSRLVQPFKPYPRD